MKFQFGIVENQMECQMFLNNYMDVWKVVTQG